MTSPHSDADAGWCFEHRALWLPRGDNSAEEWEDAYDVNPSRRLAALCDGAGSGIFSRLWANILANSVVEEQPNLTDAEALEATTTLARTEGIIHALESAHAVAEVIKRAPNMRKSEVVIVNVSGRGDKDIGILRENLKID